MTDIVQQLESFSNRHYHEARIKMAREAVREIEALRKEADKWKTAYQAAIKVGGEIEEELRRLRSAAVWQPIESAPRDVSLLLLWIKGGGWDVGFFNKITSRWDDGDYKDDLRATHWMPLPEPPK